METECKACGGIFDKEQFAVRSPGRCISCYKQQRKDHYQKNRERLLKVSSDNWNKLTPEQKKNSYEKDKEYRKNNPEMVERWVENYYKNNSELIKTQRKNRYENNRELFNKRTKSWKENRTPEQILKDKELRKIYDKENSKRIKDLRKIWESNPQNKIAMNLRSRVGVALKSNKTNKAAKTEELTGVSFLGLKDYLESKFNSGMSWDNYGEWHIDHILPCSYFDLSIEENQRICFNYRNLQPLWKYDNFSKNDTIIVEDPEKFIDVIRSTLL